MVFSLSISLFAGLLVLVAFAAGGSASELKAGILLSASGRCVQEETFAETQAKVDAAKAVAKAFSDTFLELAPDSSAWVLDCECRPDEGHKDVTDLGAFGGEFLFINTNVKDVILATERRANELGLFYIVYRLVEGDDAQRAARAAARSWVETTMSFDSNQRRSPEKHDIVQGFLTRAFNKNNF
jgi:hypothetical protein